MIDSIIGKYSNQTTTTWIILFCSSRILLYVQLLMHYILYNPFFLMSDNHPMIIFWIKWWCSANVGFTDQITWPLSALYRSADIPFSVWPLLRKCICSVHNSLLNVNCICLYFFPLVSWVFKDWDVWLHLVLYVFILVGVERCKSVSFKHEIVSKWWINTYTYLNLMNARAGGINHCNTPLFLTHTHLCRRDFPAAIFAS